MKRESAASESIPASLRRHFTGLPLLYRYILREMTTPFLVAVFIFTGVLFLARVLKLVDLVVNKNVPVTDIVLLFLFVIPQFLEFAVPMALLLGIMLAFGRLSAESELTVLRATGISLRQLVRPVMLFSAFAFVLSLLLGFYVRPWANFRLSVGLFEIAKLRASSSLIPGVFNEFGALTIYAENIDADRENLKNVVIADRRTPEKARLFIARHGQMVSDAESRNLTLRLYEGSIQEGRGLNYNVTYFDINNITLNQAELMDDDATKEGKKGSEMVLGELQAARYAMSLKPEPLSKQQKMKKARLDVEFQRRLALPFSCPVVALIAMALGVQPTRTGKTWGAALNITVGLLSICVYYLLLAFGTALGEQAIAPAWFLMWIPNIVFGAVAIFFFRKMESEEWLAVSQAIAEGVTRLSRRLFPFLNPSTAAKA